MSNELTNLESTNEIEITPSSTFDIVFDSEKMKNMIRLSEIMAAGVSTVPRHLQSNASDCLGVIMQAIQWKMNPFSVAQKTFVVSGILGYEAQLVNAVINSMAPTIDRIHYDWFGDWSKVIGKFTEKQGKNGTYKAPSWTSKDEEGLGVKVWAKMKGEDEPRVLPLLLTQAQVRNSTLWASDPKQQLAYLAVKRWSRLHCPDVIQGVYTPDELQESTERDVTPKSKPKASQAYSDMINKNDNNDESNQSEQSEKSEQPDISKQFKKLLRDIGIDNKETYDDFIKFSEIETDDKTHLQLFVDSPDKLKALYDDYLDAKVE